MERQPQVRFIGVTPQDPSLARRSREHEAVEVPTRRLPAVLPRRVPKSNTSLTAHLSMMGTDPSSTLNPAMVSSLPTTAGSPHAYPESPIFGVELIASMPVSVRGVREPLEDSRRLAEAGDIQRFFYGPAQRNYQASSEGLFVRLR